MVLYAVLSCVVAIKTHGALGISLGDELISAVNVMARRALRESYAAARCSGNRAPDAGTESDSYTAGRRAYDAAGVATGQWVVVV